VILRVLELEEKSAGREVPVVLQKGYGRKQKKKKKTVLVR